MNSITLDKNQTDFNRTAASLIDDRDADNYR